MLEWIVTFPSPEDLPNPGIEPRSPTLEAVALPSEPLGAIPVLNMLLVLSSPCISVWATAPNSSTLAWKIPWMEEPGGLPSVGLHRVGHD